MRGVRIRGQGLKLRLEKRTKPVNDGLWQRYVVTLVEPERQLHVSLDKLRLTDQGRIAFALRLSAKLRGEAHIEQWERGIKLLGTSAQGDAIVAATIDCDVGIRFEPGKLASDVLLDPHVAAISLELIDLDVHRISKLGGKAAHELGDTFTPMVARQLKRREAKLVDKANASIAKHSDRLRLPVNEFITSGWARLQSLLPVGSPGSGSPKTAQPEAAPATTAPAAAESATAAAAPSRRRRQRALPDEPPVLAGERSAGQFEVAGLPAIFGRQALITGTADFAADDLGRVIVFVGQSGLVFG